MEQRKVRRIVVEPRADSGETWDAAWVPSVARRVREWLFGASPWLVHWGGWAGIVGAALWGVIFIYLQLLEYDISWAWYLLVFLPTPPLAVPILLFLVALFGLFAQQEVQARRSTGLRRMGFLVAGTGLMTTALFSLDAYWLASLLQQPTRGLIHYDYGGLLFDWVLATDSGLTLAAIGLVVFGIAAVRSRVLPAWLAVSFIAIPPAIFVVPIGLRLFQSGYDFYAMLYGGGVFVGLMLLFGAMWAAAGYHLLRS
jgi:hypothetical protein